MWVGERGYQRFLRGGKKIHRDKKKKKKESEREREKSLQDIILSLTVSSHLQKNFFLKRYKITVPLVH